MELVSGRYYLTESGKTTWVMRVYHPEDSSVVTFVGWQVSPSYERGPLIYETDGTLLYGEGEFKGYRIVAEWEDKPDPGEGYRLLDKDEPLKEGDERWSTGQHEWTWSANASSSRIQDRMMYYRRKLEEPKYVFLKPGDIKQNGDEFWVEDEKRWGGKLTPGEAVFDDYAAQGLYRRCINRKEAGLPL